MANVAKALSVGGTYPARTEMEEKELYWNGASLEGLAKDLSMRMIDNTRLSIEKLTLCE